MDEKLIFNGTRYIKFRIFFLNFLLILAILVFFKFTYEMYVGTFHIGLFLISTILPIFAYIMTQAGIHLVKKQDLKITLQNNTTFCYSTSTSKENQYFSISDIHHISQYKAPLAFTLSLHNGKCFMLPYDIKHHDYFYSNLFAKYKIQPTNNELYQTFPVTKNRKAVSLIFELVSITINKDDIEMKIDNTTTNVTKDEIKQIKFDRYKVYKQPDRYRCQIQTNQNKKYNLEFLEISSIDLYCLLNYWYKSTN